MSTRGLYVHVVNTVQTSAVVRDEIKRTILRAAAVGFMFEPVGGVDVRVCCVPCRAVSTRHVFAQLKA